MKRFFLHPTSTFLLLVIACFSLAGCDFLGDLTSSDDEVSDDGINLFPVRIEGQWGFINENGRIIIEPEFDSGQYFSQLLLGNKFSQSPEKLLILCFLLQHQFKIIFIFGPSHKIYLRGNSTSL